MPPASGVVQAVQGADTLSDADQELIVELFDSLETAHDQFATASGLIGRLSHTLKPGQLMIVLKASIRPLIQLRMAARLELDTTAQRPTELPEKQAERTEMFIFPDPNTSQLRKEKINSPTRLLTATYTFKVNNKFSEGTMQWGIQEWFQVKAKQLATCITDRKYMGGTDRKRKLLGTNEGASSLKKPTLK